MPGASVLDKARKSAAEAVKAKADCPEGHAIGGVISALHDFEWNEAEETLRRAIPMNPSDGHLRLWYGLCAMIAGRFQDALREIQKTQQANPTSITAHLAAGFACHLNRDYDEALLQYRLAQELSPSAYAPHLAMGLLFTDQQMFEQAHHSLSQASQLSPRNPNVLGALVYGH